MTGLDRADFAEAARIERALAAVRAPGRVVGHVGDAWGLVMTVPPRRGTLGSLAAALAAVLGAPVKLWRRGRQLLVSTRRR